MSAAMSDITPPSYMDDGASFSRRLPPRSSSAIGSQWLSSTSSDTTSGYTGSYIDDGADLLLPTAPGFGAINARFYKHKKRRDDETRGPWNQAVARAVGGDIQRSLSKMRGVANVEIKRLETSSEDGKKRRAAKRGAVIVPAPLKWGTFIIKSDDGRIVVIGENEEFDSGPVRVSNEKTMGGTREDQRWVKAASSVDMPRSIMQSTDLRRERARRSQHGDQAQKPLAPILESRSEYEDDELVRTWPLASPTGFFMAGGMSGWPPQEASPGPASRIVPHAITWHTTLSRPASVSATTTSSSSKDLKEHNSWSRSKYKAPAMIEVTYDETPPGEVSHSQTGWGGEAASAHNWSESHKPSSIASVRTHSSVRDLGWKDPAVASRWGGSEAERSQSLDRNSQQSKHGHQLGGDEWDGFERAKTASEISVVGSGSERSWAGRSTFGAHSMSKPQNGYDEDNATYLEASWGGVPVRVARSTSVVGWD